MATTRCEIDDFTNDTAGNSLAGGSGSKYYLFASDGTAVAGASPTGTAVTMYTAATGGTTQANPITPTAGGKVRIWVDGPAKVYDCVAVYAGQFSEVFGIASHPVSPGGHLSVSQPPPVIFLDPVNGEAKASGNVDYIGRDDHPYLLL